MRYIWSFLLLLLALVSANSQELKPYTIGAITDMPVADAKARVVQALSSQNLQVVGVYDNVHTDAAVVVYTSKALLQAVKQVGGLSGFAATQRVAITRESDHSVISFTTPEYWGNAYFRDDFEKVAPAYEALNTAVIGSMKQVGVYLGEPFGSEKGVSVDDLRSYRYMFGMPRFDDTVELGVFDSFEAAVSHIDGTLDNGIQGVVEVYKLEIPGMDAVLYGFGLTDPEGEQQFMPKIDIGDHKHTAFLPYEVLVVNKEVHMLHGRYRIALSFPDLTMKTFTKIMSTPGYIEDTFAKVVVE